MAEDWNLGGRLEEKFLNSEFFSTVLKSIEMTHAHCLFVKGFAAAFQLFVLW